MGCACKQLPSAGTQAVNAVAAAGRIGGAAIMGRHVVVASEVFECRMGACKTCPEVVFLKEHHRCSRCGCWLDGKYFAKAKLETETCPLGRWEAKP